VIRLSLPWPPSVNRIWRTPNKGPLAGRTMLSTEGREYRRAVHAIALVELGRELQIESRLAVTIFLTPPDKRRRDIDNCAKAILDGLMHAGVYRDDCQIDALRILRGPVRQNDGEAFVEITELPEAA